MKRALITGITGQDGVYLSKLLLSKGYKVYGVDRRTSLATTDRLHYLGVVDDVTLLDGDVTDQGSLVRALRTAEPDEVYNLAAQSFVGPSWQQPALTAEVTGVGAVNVLEAVLFASSIPRSASTRRRPARCSGSCRKSRSRRRRRFIRGARMRCPSSWPTG